VPQALELLKNNPMRTFRVEIATDSMLYADEAQEKQDRVEFMQATGAFIEKAIQGAQQVPELTPLLMDLLKFGVQGFRVGRTLEGEFDTFADEAKEKQAQKAAQPPAQPQPTPEMIKAQSEQQKMQMEAQLEAQRLEFDKYKVELENNTKVLIAEMGAKTDLHLKSIDINAAKEQETLTEMSPDGFEQPTSALSELIASINNNMAMMVQTQQQHNQDLVLQQQAAHDNLVGQLTKPKQVVRGADGKIIGVQ